MKISEVSERSGISSDTLRYYERIGLIPPVNRNKNGIRDYNEIDVKRVEFIKCMRSAGLPIEALIEYYGLVQQGDQTIEIRKEILATQAFDSENIKYEQRWYNRYIGGKVIKDVATVAKILAS